MSNPAVDTQRSALIIFAQNEAPVIQETVRLVKQALGSMDALYVIADQCTDGTAALAEEAGSQVFERDLESPCGKGAALGWFISNHWDLLKEFKFLVILDADSRIGPEFLDQVAAEMGENFQAGQCLLSPMVRDDSPLSLLIALSEIIEQSVFDRIRSHLGWPVRLRGTGMVFIPTVLHGLGSQIDTEVEDIALTILLAARKVTVRLIQSAIVCDPKPSEVVAASRQRARWFRGQWAAFQRYHAIIGRIILRGPTGWSVLSSLFLKPRWLKLAVMTGLGLLLIKIPVAAALLFSLVLLELLMVLFGILRLPDRRSYLQALTHLPGFIWMWLQGIILSFQRLPWLRARDDGMPQNPSSDPRM